MQLNQILLLVIAGPMVAVAPLAIAPASLWRAAGMPLALEGIARVLMRHWAAAVGSLGALLLVAALNALGGPLLQALLAVVAAEKIVIVLLMAKHREVAAGTRRLIFIIDGTGALLALWLVTRV